MPLTALEAGLKLRKLVSIAKMLASYAGIVCQTERGLSENLHCKSPPFCGGAS